MPHFKLTYYNARGSAETSRLILAYAGVEYEDIRIPIGSLTVEKKAELNLTYGYLPSLEIDGEVFTQYLPIARYLAAKYGLVGENQLENLRIEESVFVMAEYVKKWIPVLCENFPDEPKEELKKKILSADNPRVMKYYDNLLMKNEEAGNSWLVGEKITWADMVFAHFTSTFEFIPKIDFLEDYPRLRALRQRVLDQPGIKEYIANRPATKF